MIIKLDDIESSCYDSLKVCSSGVLKKKKKGNYEKVLYYYSHIDSFRV